MEKEPLLHGVNTTIPSKTAPKNMEAQTRANGQIDARKRAAMIRCIKFSVMSALLGTMPIRREGDVCVVFMFAMLGSHPFLFVDIGPS